MNAEFNWWLLIVGVVVGAVLTYLVLADSARRDHDITEAELPAEAGWIARTLTDEGRPVDADTAERVLRTHRRYLALPPPDALVDPATLEPVDPVTGVPRADPPESLDPTPPPSARAAAEPVIGREPGT